MKATLLAMGMFAATYAVHGLEWTIPSAGECRSVVKDEPALRFRTLRRNGVCPTHVGMNRIGGFHP